MGKPGSAELAAAGFVRRRGAVGTARIEALREQAQLAEGEASTIILADELKADLVLIDEKAARAAAKGMGLAVAGTMRVLELSFERKLIADLRATYVKLKAGPARISPGLLNASLSRLSLPPLS
jgi:predicted nucleic acid-binding protein